MVNVPYSPRHAMTPPPPPKKPRPVSTASVAAPSEPDPSSDARGVPGLAAVIGLAARVRTDEHGARKAAIAAVAAGVLLFGAAEALGGTAFGSSGGHHPSQAGAVQAAEANATVPPNDTTSLSAGAPRGRKTVPAKPVHVKKKAPSTKKVISGLARNGIPNVALNAYRVAAARADHNMSGCHIDWALLAGIGRVESNHGRFGGATLHADGTSTPKIIGPALDGISWDYVPAPANGLALDGDAVYAHALGPMQFIPSTWDIYGADANGDGKADIFNINDAALAAARYLCTAGGNLSTEPGQATAVFAYNHSDEYVAQVLALAAAYRAGIPVSGVPSGNTTGGLPGINQGGGTPPPVNPGGPTAVQKSPAKSPTKSPTGTSGGGGKSGGSGGGKSGGGSGGGTSGGGGKSGGSGGGKSGGGGTSTGSGPTKAPTTTLPITIPTLPISLPGQGSSTHKTTPPKSSPTPTCLLTVLGQCVKV